MRKCIKALLALALCLALLPVAALASPGDAVLARRDDASFTDYIRATASLGDTLYLLGNSGVYTWKPGEADLTMYEGKFENDEWSEDNSSSTYSNVAGMVAWNGEIYIIENVTRFEAQQGTNAFEGMYLSKLVFGEDGTCTCERGDQLDWEPLMEYYDENEYARSPEQTVVVGDTLYAKIYGDNGIELYAIPLDGGYSKQVEGIEELYAFAAYTEGRLLVEELTYNDGYTITLKTYDPESDSMDLVYSKAGDDYDPLVGIAVDPENGFIYYQSQGMLDRLDVETLDVVPVNDLPANAYSESGALLLDGGYYVTATYEAVIVRNTDPALRAEKTLSVCNSAYVDAINRAYYDFGNARGDVSVAISTDYSASQNLVEAMMNHSTQYDIYVIRGTESAYSAVYNRGYMTELSGSKILSDFVGQMYPGLIDQLQYNGQLVAIPFEPESSTFAMSKAALEKLGCAPEDVPANWPDFLDWLGTLAPKMEEAGVSLAYEWETQANFREELFNHIFTDYQKYLNYSGQEQGYNTDLLYNALKKLEELDLSAFGLPEEINYDEDGSFGGSWSEEDSKSILFQGFTSCTIADSYSFREYIPLLLSMDANTPAIMQLSVSYAFVNPYSENKEEAIAFLETATGSMRDAQKASLIPTMNEPARSSYYEENKKSIQEELDNINSLLAEATGEDKQMYEDMLRDYQQYMEYIEYDMWEISPYAIEWYRAHDDNIIFEKYHPLYSGESSAEIYDILQQYIGGTMTLEQMLRSIDQKVQMMVLEGN